MNPVQSTPSHLSKIHFNIIFAHSLGLPSGLFPSGFPTNILPIRATRPANLILLDFIILIMLDEGYKL
jgi:hypothetical protein